MKKRLRKNFQHYKRFDYSDFKPKNQIDLSEYEQDIFQKALRKLRG